MSNTYNKKHRLAIEAIEICTLSYRVSFVIQFNGKKKYATDNQKKWIITVMKQKFTDNDFSECARMAVEFVYNSFEANKGKII